MKIVVKVLYVVFSVVLLIYLALPNPDFPTPPPDSIRSYEPADVESDYRRGYYTNYTREEVMLNYLSQLDRSSILNLPIPTYRLNYPPEEAQFRIRDQTRSTYLEEIVHPFRESFFINGFEPILDKDMIYIDKVHWRQKIIIKYEPSNVYARLFVTLLTLIVIPVLFSEWGKLVKSARKLLR
jgi:hypothetical protein